MSKGYVLRLYRPFRVFFSSSKQNVLIFEKRSLIKIAFKQKSTEFYRNWSCIHLLKLLKIKIDIFILYLFWYFLLMRKYRLKSKKLVQFYTCFLNNNNRKVYVFLLKPIHTTYFIILNDFFFSPEISWYMMNMRKMCTFIYHKCSAWIVMINNVSKVVTGGSSSCI